MIQHSHIPKKALLWLVTAFLLSLPCDGGYISTIIDIDKTNTTTASSSDDNITQQDDQSDGVFTDMNDLVVIFFFLAAGWLFLAMLYSMFILFVLRLQSRGQLDIYDPDFGRLMCCNGRISLNCSCILRRYAIRLELLRTGEDPNAPERRIHIMTRGERRAAMEKLLEASTNKTANVDVPIKCIPSIESEEGPLCTICLDFLSLPALQF